MNQKILDIANQLRNYFFTVEQGDDFHIFLCGGANKTQSVFRDSLRDKIHAMKSRYRYFVYYPEDLFLELMLGHKKYDILDLENILATSVSSVVIPLQSPGTFTELGAFTNHPDLCDKLIAIIEPKYKNKQSFISTGPIRRIKNSLSSSVLYQPLTHENIPELSGRITEATRKISAQKPLSPAITKPLTSSDFFWSLIYVFEPLKIDSVIQIATALAPDESPQTVSVAARTALNRLINQRKISLADDYLYMPPEALKRALIDIPTVKKTEALLNFLSPLRIKGMNHILRRRFLL